MKETGSLKNGKQFRNAMIFPIIVGVILLIAIFPAFLFGVKAGILASAVFVIYVIVAVVFILIMRKRFYDSLKELVRGYGLMENRMIEDFPLPYAITDKSGGIYLYNDRFGQIKGREPDRETLKGIFRELSDQDFEFEATEKDISVVYDKRRYRLHLTKLPLKGAKISGKLVELPKEDKYVLAAYLIDETEIINMMQKLYDEQPVVCSIRVDDYEEIFEQVDDINKSLVNALIDKEVSSYFGQIGGLIRKIDKNRYFVIFEKKYLAGMQRNKFDLLDNIRKLNTDSDIPVTISAGIGVGGSYMQSQDYAKTALELALGRGGDQVVVKEGERVYFYGGKIKSVEKNTRVKARVTALALREIIQSKDHVVIMGHKIGDTDCFGAAIGIYKAAKVLGKKAYIVLNELNNSVQPILAEFLDNDEYGDGVFLAVNEAPRYVNEDTALVIVDANRPEIFECPELIYKTKTIVMIDHHLQSGDRIDNIALQYVEPSASSASEMVTELLQYVTGDVRLTKLEAEALYAGILIDTDYLTKNTGVKTFEAAAVLRKNGVDIGKVNGLFSDTLEDFKLKAETIKTAELFEKGFAIAVSPSDGVDNPTIVAAQVANELLTISGIRASFVLVDYAGKIYISARSKSDVNVQLIMERMGGGGHMNVAGAQLEGSTVDDAIRKVKQTVRKMLDEGVLKI